MQVHSMEFKARAGQKLADQRLQQNLKKLSTKFVTARADAIRDIDFDATREALRERRDRALENLDVWLATFEENATKRGATVLFAETTADAARLVAEIAQKHGVKKVIKSKSMVTEEMRLNQVLGEMGVQSIETTWVNTSCRSTTRNRRRTSLRRWCTRTRTRSPTCSPGSTTSRG